MIGLAQGAFDATMPYLHQRKQFGQLIGDFQAMQVRLQSKLILLISRT
jgi:alkylation response protein AidB-like acyl-CoA dehydrogenase